MHVKVRYGAITINNKEENDSFPNVTCYVKCKSSLIVNLKAIKSGENIICYLSSYLHCSFYQHLVIIILHYSIINSLGQLGLYTNAKVISCGTLS